MLCKSASDKANMVLGLIAVTLFFNLFQIVVCALVDICCPIMEFTNAANKSGITLLFGIAILSITAANLASLDLIYSNS